MKKARKIVSLLMTFCILLGMLSVSASAITKTQTPDFSKFTEYWINTQYSQETKVNEIIPIIDGAEEVIGYSISFKENETPCGYVILDMSDNYDSNPIVEYSLDGIDPYTAMSNSATKKFSKIEAKTLKSKKLRSETFYNYGIELATEQGYKVYSSSDGLVSKDIYDKNAKIKTSKITEVKKESQNNKKNEKEYIKASTNFWDAWLDTAPGTAKTTKTITKASSFVSLNMSQMPSYSGSGYTAGYYEEGNCGPTSLTIIVKYWDECRGMSNLLKSNSVTTTYKRLSKLSGYTPVEGTVTANLISAIKDYAKEQGYTAKVSNYLFDTWSNFKGDLDGNKTIFLSVGGKDADGVELGHASVVFGYRITTDGSKYLRIANCWDTSTNRYIKFKPSELSWFNGYAVSITD